ncbi:leucine-rich repeat-containing protein [Pseudomonas trivialis]|uniref:RING-type E3 ubiquitin transferase n=1 Tax=Pseudomonas trivialis TaxID=200450 RepID=A0A0R2ZCE2_9PSED|nr:leucine-rich repeat-containing protein [Pseudomonas trivialis]
MRGAHYDFLKARVPDWFNQASTQRQEELASHELHQLPTWYQAALPQARRVLEATHTGYRAALNALEQTLGDITDVLDFAEEALTAAIKRTFNLDLDVKNVYFARKYAYTNGRTDLFGAFTLERQADPSLNERYLHVSLLEAALANFEPDEELPSSCDDCHIITRYSGFDGEAIPSFEALREHAVPIAPHAFAKLCRTLNLGERYQVHLKSVLRPAATVERDKVQQLLQDYYRQQLALSVEVAHLQIASVPGNGEIDSGVSDEAYRMLKRVLAQTPGANLDGRPLTFAALKIFDIQLVGPLLIGPDRLRSERVERVLVFIPNDPQQPLKEYASSADFMADLRMRLHSASYRRFFSSFVPAREQGAFFGQFNQRYQPADQSDASLDYPLQPNPERLSLGESAVTDTLWVHQAKAFIDKTLNDARAVAVPTGDEDLKARNRRLESYQDAVVSFLNLAAFVVPGLGPVMLAVGAAQMCGEVFEGIEAAEQGEVREMWAHFSSVALNAAFFAAGAKVLPSVKYMNVLDRYKPVIMPKGKQMLWKADLEPYESPVTPTSASNPDAPGLRAHDGKTLLSIEGKSYQVSPDAQTGEYRIQHPTRPKAYAPKVARHPQGTWSHELEEPLTWDEHTLYRRLGLEHYADQVRISGVEAPTLRETFVDHEPLPMVLDETIQRFQIHQQLSTFVEQMSSSDPKVYAQADLALQLDIMQRRGMLSHSSPLRVLDSSGKVLWEGVGPASAERRIAPISQAEIDSGQLLDGVLYTLQGVDPALLEIPGSPQDPLSVRARLLRRFIASTVDTLKGTLLDERYAASTRSTDPDVQRVQADYPGLSAPMAAHMLEGLDAAALEHFHASGRLPNTLAERMRWCAQETRVSRAYEGLHLDTLHVIDSQRLALHTLQTLPGWPGGTRVELRHYSAEGPLLDAIGAAGAPLTKTLVLQENGLFAGLHPGDIYAAAWEALAPAERQGLGISDAVQLKQAIERSPLPRPALRRVLLEHPVRKPPYHPSLRLFGGGPGFRQLLSRTAQALRSPEARVRKLFPSYSDAQVSEFLRSLGGDVSGGLARRELEIDMLERTLKRWVKDNTSPSAESAFERNGGWAAGAARDIARCWRRTEGSEHLTLNTHGATLPVVNADFSHVQVLEVVGSKTGGNVDAFLRHFTHLQRLKLSCDLTELPMALSGMQALTSLDLAWNGIRLTAQSAATLSGLTALEELNLRNNPLGRPLDFGAMPRLKRVNLDATQMDQWPAGLQPSLELLDLRNNNLRRVPEAHLNPAPEQLETIARINRVTLLGGNPFPKDYWRVFDAYWKRLGESHPDLAAGALHDAFDSGMGTGKSIMRRLYPDYSAQQIRAFIWTLGADAGTRLLALEREFSRLESQLDAWTFSGIGARQRYVRPQQWQMDVAVHSGRYEARQRILRCWRRDSPQRLASDGTPIGLELDLGGLRLPSLPDLEADFSHVGSLKLNNMNLTVSPEGFLARYQGVRWLDLSGNQLHELPPAVGQMHGLTRLFLQFNNIRLTPEAASILSERVTLRALDLSYNNLGIAPDFTRITDMRSLNLAHTGLDTWPAGLLEQPLLDGVGLSGNRMTTIPGSLIAPSDEQLATTARVNNVTDASDNPWTDTTLQEVRAYGERLERAGLASPERPNRLVVTAPRRANQAVSGGGNGAAFRRWVVGLSETEAATRNIQWQSLRGQTGSQGFFDVLRDLQTTSGGHEDLQQRVWEVIDSITANSTQSESLREQMFEWAGRAACCDRAALSFSNLEIMTLVDKARLQALDATQGVELSNLSKGLFRLDEVERISLRDIDQRRTTINANAVLTPAEKAVQLARLEEVEIRLAYRYGLKDRLQLPGQPRDVKFMQLGKVTPPMLDAAYTSVVALDNSAQMFQALLAREFWQDYVTQKYRPRFEAQSKPYQDRMAALHDRFSDGTLTESVYDSQAKALQAQLAIDDAALIDTLTRQEIAAHLLPQAPLQTLIEPVFGQFTLPFSHAQAIEFEGKPYFIASLPDAGDGQHYLLRVQSSDNPYELVSSGIIAKPDAAGMWKRRGLKGGGLSDDEYESASESMPITPYTADELAFMRQAVHFSAQKNELGRYNRANNGKYPLRDLQGRPIRIRSLERQARMDSGALYASTPIKPYIQFEGYERVAALYEEKLQWRTFTADDVQVPGEKALIGQSMVVANRRIAKGEIIGLYGGVVIPYEMSVRSESTFGMVVGYKLLPDAGSYRSAPIFIIGDTITSRINTHFDYDPQGKPVRQASGGYNVECVPFQVEAEHASSVSGKRTTYQLTTLFATQDIPAGVELRMDYGYTESMIKTRFA